jgi:hypothetical protein
MALHEVITSVDEVASFFLKFKVITESHPAAFVVVKVAVLFEVAYVLPSNQVMALHELITSVDAVASFFLKFKVITESHPAALVVVKVAVLFDDEYVFPSNQMMSVHELITSIDEVDSLFVKFNVITESHPAAFVVVKVAVLFDDV